MTRKVLTVFIVIFMFVSVLALPVCGDVYYETQLKDLKNIPEKFRNDKDRAYGYRDWANLGMRIRFMQPYAVGKSAEEFYFVFEKSKGHYTGWSGWDAYSSPADNIALIKIVSRTPGKKSPNGYLFLPKKDLSGMFKVPFSVQTPAADQTLARKNFLEAKRFYYQNLLNRELPGAAWFRHQKNEAAFALEALKGENKEKKPAARPARPRRRSESEMERTYSLFSGGRALSENLQLDRELRIASPGEATVPVDSIKGITTAEIDWKKDVQGMKPKKDSLARYIPSDQYAVFFATFQRMMDFVDESDARGTPVLQLMEPRSEDALTRARYQRQLCLPYSQLSRLFGPKVVAGVAVTGSDPYLRVGTDIAVLFEAKSKMVLTTTIAARQLAAVSAGGGCKKVDGSILGVPYSGVLSPDRSVCSYLASPAENVVVVSNSLVQLEGIIAAAKGKKANIFSLDEYTFFRNRYKPGENHEVAFLLITDAAIRKWCSPRWRIADSRRTRNAAAMAEIQAQYLGELAKGNIKSDRLIRSSPVPGGGDIKMTPRGVTSSSYGRLNFMTPICEIPLNKVTKEEVRAYEWFRTNYQKQWRQYFDPIAIRFTLEEKKVAIDLSIRPLIAQSSYKELIRVCGNSAIRQDSGDPHPEALLHYILSLDKESSTVKQATNFTNMMAPQLGSGPLNWIGEWLSIYIDRDPLWDELTKIYTEDGQKGVTHFLEKNFNRFPAALALNVSNPLKLTLFLAGLRAFIEQTAPGLTEWNALKHKGHSYVCITAKEKSSSKAFKIYYAPTSKALFISLSENVIKSFLQRVDTPASKRGLKGGWLGKSMCIQAREPLLDIFRILYGNPMKRTLQRRSWGNIVILNEWRRNFGRYLAKKGPLAFHQLYWQMKLLCPGGGDYVWNEEFQTMESTVFGHPGIHGKIDKLNDPLESIVEANLGVTFESNGLRARGELIRKESD
ncbi:MAG: hypothetical protein GY757_16575 [bacterium]|nr:hypothetical protein [bacterium]